MRYINIKNYINGNIAISYDDGVKCKEDIKEFLDAGEDVALDFTDVEFVITAFLNPVIGDLIMELGDDVMQHIEIHNINKSILKK